MKARPAFILLSTSVVITLLGAFGCAEKVRRYTYPPDFTYIKKEELSTTMWKFAVAVASLNHILQAEDSVATNKQSQVIQQLEEMEKLGQQLGLAGGTNHPLIDTRIEAFRSDLETARRAAQRKPPNYYLAGRITGSCSNCHALRP